MRQGDAAVAPGSTEGDLFGAGGTLGQSSGGHVEAGIPAAGGQFPHVRTVIRGSTATRVITGGAALGTGARATRETSVLLVIVTWREDRVTVTSLGARGTCGVTSAEAPDL